MRAQKPASLQATLVDKLGAVAVSRLEQQQTAVEDFVAEGLQVRDASELLYVIRDRVAVPTVAVQVQFAESFDVQHRWVVCVRRVRCGLVNVWLGGWSGLERPMGRRWLGLLGLALWDCRWLGLPAAGQPRTIGFGGTIHKILKSQLVTVQRLIRRWWRCRWRRPRAQWRWRRPRAQGCARRGLKRLRHGNLNSVLQVLDAGADDHGLEGLVVGADSFADGLQGLVVGADGLADGIQGLVDVGADGLADVGADGPLGLDRTNFGNLDYKVARLNDFVWVHLDA